MRAGTVLLLAFMTGLCWLLWRPHVDGAATRDPVTIEASNGSTVEWNAPITIGPTTSTFDLIAYSIRPGTALSKDEALWRLREGVSLTFNGRRVSMCDACQERIRTAIDAMGVTTTADVRRP